MGTFNLLLIFVALLFVYRQEFLQPMNVSRCLEKKKEVAELKVTRMREKEG